MGWVQLERVFFSIFFFQYSSHIREFTIPYLMIFWCSGVLWNFKKYLKKWKRSLLRVALQPFLEFISGTVVPESITSDFSLIWKKNRKPSPILGLISYMKNKVGIFASSDRLPPPSTIVYTSIIWYLHIYYITRYFPVQSKKLERLHSGKSRKEPYNN